MKHIELPEKLTFGVMIDLATKIETKEEAEALLAALVTQARQEDPAMTEEEALRTTQSNLGYLGGYLNVETQRKWEVLFGAVHPVFGPVGGDKEPKTALETFQMGIARALKAPSGGVA